MHSGINEHKALMMAERGRKRNFNFKNFLALASIIVLISILPNIYVSYLVEPSGDAEINKIATNISMQNNSENEKIKSILDWEVKTKNFSDTYGKYNINTIAVRYFGSNPQIISYYMSGNCQELAFLFNEVANRAGIDSRVVGTSTEDHAWDEVKIDNKWIPVDPTIYYDNIHNNKNISWFNNTRAYEYDEGWFKLSNVHVIDTYEDVTNKYSNMGTLRIIFKPSDRIIIRTTKGDGVFNDTTLRDVSSYAINSKSSKLEIDLGEKNYTVIAEKDIIPFWATFRDMQEIRVKKGETVTIQLSPNKLKLIGLNVT
jgi:hypothetical protein